MSVDHNKPLLAIVWAAAELMVHHITFICWLVSCELMVMVGKRSLKLLFVFTKHRVEKFAWWALQSCPSSKWSFVADFWSVWKMWVTSVWKSPHSNYIRVMMVYFLVSAEQIKLPCAHEKLKAQMWSGLLSEAAHQWQNGVRTDFVPETTKTTDVQFLADFQIEV